MDVVVRAAEARDAEALGRMGAALVHLHHALEPRRFMLPPDVEAGYRAWLERERSNRAAGVLVATRGEEVVGYAYGRMEGRDWDSLRERCGMFVDLWVEPSARRSGVGTRLCQAMLEWFQRRKAPRVVLMTASGNESAQRLFARAGFVPTMVEMTREL